jgi:hypothetical protein
MRWTSWAFLAFIGSLMFLVLFIKDLEIKRGVERLSKTKVTPQSQLQLEFDVQLAGTKKEETCGLHNDMDEMRGCVGELSFKLSISRNPLQSQMITAI